MHSSYRWQSLRILLMHCCRRRHDDNPGRDRETYIYICICTCAYKNIHIHILWRAVLMRFKWWRHLAFMSVNINSGQRRIDTPVLPCPGPIDSRPTGCIQLRFQLWFRCSVISSNRAHLSQPGPAFCTLLLLCSVVGSPVANWYLNTRILITIAISTLPLSLSLLHTLFAQFIN